MILEIIKIFSAIILGTIVFGIVLFLFYFLWQVFDGLVQGIKQGLKEVYKENNVSSWEEFIEKKKKDKLK
jgi:uncharacterized membrane-anchored protein YitT (DUF2179 family)